jgi:hypothetical protein
MHVYQFDRDLRLVSDHVYSANGTGVDVSTHLHIDRAELMVVWSEYDRAEGATFVFMRRLSHTGESLALPVRAARSLSPFTLLQDADGPRLFGIEYRGSGLAALPWLTTIDFVNGQPADAMAWQLPLFGRVLAVALPHGRFAFTLGDTIYFMAQERRRSTR